MHKHKLVVSGIALLVFACGDKKDEESEKSSATKPTAKSAGNADPSVWKDIELPKLGLIANAPGDSKVSRLGGLSGLKYKCQPTITATGDRTPGYDNVLTNIQGTNHGGFQEMVRNEKTNEDTFKIEWTTKSGKFGYSSRQSIGAKVYSCTAVSSNKAGHDCVMKVCDSLKPL